MSRKAKVWWVLVILFVLVVAIWWQVRVPGELTVQEARARGIAKVTARGIDVEKLTIEVGSTANTTVVVPAGTLFVSRGQGTQNMMVAETVRVVFTNASSNAPQLQ